LAGKTKNKKKNPISQNLVFETPLSFFFLFLFFCALFRVFLFFMPRFFGKTAIGRLRLRLFGERDLRVRARCERDGGARRYAIPILRLEYGLLEKERKKERRGERIYGGGKWEGDDGVLAMLVEFASVSVSGICSYYCDYRLLGIA
jgi:hypothetical protein